MRRKSGKERTERASSVSSLSGTSAVLARAAAAAAAADVLFKRGGSRSSVANICDSAWRHRELADVMCDAGVFREYKCECGGGVGRVFGNWPEFPQCGAQQNTGTAAFMRLNVLDHRAWEICANMCVRKVSEFVVKHDTRADCGDHCHTE